MKSIFISSTYNDLKDERDKAIYTINNLYSANPIAMERFSSNPEPSKAVCLSRLRKSDLVLLILGFKYGSEDPEEKISITEIEYNEAKNRNIPVFVFIKKNANDKWIADENEAETKEKLENFKKRLDSERTRVTFQHPEELGEEIALAIYNYESENGEIISTRQLENGESFFAQLLNEEHLFNHCHPFFGRDDLFQQLYELTGSNKKILIVHGRGGIGKSKLLFELQKKISSEQEYKVWFLRDGAVISNDIYQEIPLKRKNIIIVDDVHRINNLEILLKIALENPDSIKLILSLRNYGVKYLKNQCLQNGFDPSEIEILNEISDLKLEDLNALADSILDENHKSFRDALVSVARDSPLVLVIGAKLVNKNSISPSLLSTDQEFKSLVFAKFSDVLMGEVSDEFEKEDVMKIHRSSVKPTIHL